MAIDWGGVLSGAVDIIQGQPVGGASQSFMPNLPAPAPGATAPSKVTIDTKTGKVTECKRRRRRRLLTESDFNDLMRISTLPSKENVRIALAKAIGRR